MVSDPPIGLFIFQAQWFFENLSRTSDKKRANVIQITRWILQSR